VERWSFQMERRFAGVVVVVGVVLRSARWHEG
jgi:hypothetical protein